MKKINWTILIFIGLLFAHIAYADIDPWYLNNPSCVIDRGNPARTGEYLTQPVEKFHGIKWKIRGSLHSPICARNLLISVPQAINMIDGKQMWSTDVSFDSGDVTFYKGIVYTTNHDTIDNSSLLVGYNAVTGQTVFKLLRTDIQRATSGAYFSPLVYNDVVYFDLLKSVIAYDLKANKILWRFDLDAAEPKERNVQVSPLSTDGERIYFGDWKGTLYALDMKTGKIQWTFKKPATIAGFPIFDGKIYISQGFEIDALDATTGKISWRYLPKKPVGSDFAISEKILVVGSREAGLIALNTKTRKLIWHFPCYLTSSPVIAGNVVYIKSHYNMLYAIDKKTGKELWHYDTEDDGDLIQTGAILPYQGVIYVHGGKDQYDTNIIAIY